MTDLNAPKKPAQTVLIVEDEPIFAEFLESILEAEDIPFITAGSVAQACALLDEKRVALVLLDWRLDRSGLHVLRYSRNLYPNMPVIVMSSVIPDVKGTALLAEADSFLEKAAIPTLLATHVKWWLKRVEAISQASLPMRPQDIVSFEELERTYIRHVVGLLGGNITLAAEKLGIHRHTIASKLRLENLDKQSTINC